ncbi:TetR family transcriptional regulator [Alteromonas sp. RW2A1]|uniref:TetR/AcrR family transcriptional regulator n=1 Tax=Alteromonas sp. RW2A1 TaxID=1917158 RepID=UPI0009033C4E|nr:TetR/AcrR family transcriptional regulator [Alteromonas sp. RW2A1]APE05721.1 TetR family transcriptional regulator [Alteromonas sp. RW2A1]
MTDITRRRSDKKREAIIQAATQAFQEFGVNGTSMDKLAELANVSKRTVYNHFSTKEDLVMHLIKEQWQSALVDINAEYKSDSPLNEQLEELVFQEVSFMCSDSHLELARVAIGHFFYKPEKLKDEVTQLKAQESSLHRWLKKAEADNRLTFEDIGQVVNEIDSLIKGQSFWPRLFKIEDNLSDDDKWRITRNIVAMVLSRYEC